MSFGIRIVKSRIGFILRRQWPKTLLFLLIITTVFSHWLWFKFDQFPVVGHELLGHLPAVQIYRDILGLNTWWHCYNNPFGTYTGEGYPPLSYLIFGLYYVFVGPQGQAIQLVNSIYVISALLGVFLIGRTFAHARLGLLAAVLLSAFPGFIAYAREYRVEFGLIAYSSLAIWLLYRTDYFENMKVSVLLGIIIGLGFLHKYEIIGTVGGPLIFFVGLSLLFRRQMLSRRIQKVSSIMAMLIAGFIVVSWWIIPYGKDLMNRVIFSTTHTGEVNAEQPVYAPIDNLLFYAKQLNGLLGNVYFSLLVLSIIILIAAIFLRKGMSKEKTIILLAWFFCPYVIFTIAKAKGASHILSLLPPSALIISSGIYAIPVRLVRWVFLLLIISVALAFQVFPFFPRVLRYPPFTIVPFTERFAAERLHWHYGRMGHPGLSPPRKEQIEQTIIDVLSFIREDSYGIPHPMAISFFRRGALKNNVFEFYNLERNYGVLFPACYETIERDKGLAPFDYLIAEVSGGEDISAIFKNNYPIWDNELRMFSKIVTLEGLRQFELCKEFIIPASEDQRLLVYRKRAPMKQRSLQEG